MPKLILPLIITVVCLLSFAPAAAEFYEFAEDEVFYDETASATHNFKLTATAMDPGAAGYDWLGLCRVAVDIYAKEAPETLLQRLNMEIPLELDEQKRLHYRNNINCLDINFDGYDDLAVYNGNMGSYGGPSYNIYLYNPANKMFERHELLEEIQAMGLGMFEVDAELGVIGVYSKSGCCYHQYDEYRFRDNMPEPVYTKTEALAINGAFLEYTEARLVNGRWEEKIWEEPLPEDE